VADPPEHGPCLRGRPLRRALGAGVALALVACQSADTPPGEEIPPAFEDPAGAGQPGLAVPYEVAIEGVEGELLGLLEQVSETRRLADRPPSSFLQLRRRAENDVANLTRALHSRGHYGAAVEVAIDREATPARVTFAVEPGPVYHFRDVAIEVDPAAPELKLPSLADLGIAPGSPAVAQTILDAESRILAQAREQGFALAEAGERQALIEQDAAVMDLTLRLRPGPRVRIGEIRVTGLTDVDEDYVRRVLPWEREQFVTTSRMDEGDTALRDTGLFSSIRIETGNTPNDQGEVPVTVSLAESKHRSIEVGVRYRTDEGPGGNISWQHRNFFGEGEQVELELDASGIGGFLAASFRKPAFFRRDQALITRSRAGYEDTEAYTSRFAGAGVALERELRPGMTLSAGPAFRAAKIEEADGEEEFFGLVSLPVAFDWDRSDNLLDPTRGGRLLVDNEPFVDTFGSGVRFNRARVGYSHYLKVLDEPRIVLAGRVAVGSIVGASRDDVPADLRFYAGGGGSVRGFGFQLAGELDEDDDPVGGRSLFETSFEVRANVTETIGVVAFVDAGSAFEASLPDFEEPLRVGAGPGLRYFSPVGPIRLDVGFPVNGRDNDDPFQIYVSIGQAF
jgi:translocation and assembly module TamA